MSSFNCSSNCFVVITIFPLIVHANQSFYNPARSILMPVFLLHHSFRSPTVIFGVCSGLSGGGAGGRHVGDAYEPVLWSGPVCGGRYCVFSGGRCQPRCFRSGKGQSGHISSLQWQKCKTETRSALSSCTLFGQRHYIFSKSSNGSSAYIWQGRRVDTITGFTVQLYFLSFC